MSCVHGSREWIHSNFLPFEGMTIEKGRGREGREGGMEGGREAGKAGTSERGREEEREGERERA